MYFYTQDVDQKYSDGWIEEIPDLPFEFTGESLIIRIPERDAIPGWHIAKKSPNEVIQKDLLENNQSHDILLRICMYQRFEYQYIYIYNELNFHCALNFLHMFAE